MRTERFNVVVAFMMLALVVVMTGLGNHFIDGIY